jgi:hypothetical protein
MVHRHTMREKNTHMTNKNKQKSQKKKEEEEERK